MIPEHAEILALESLAWLASRPDDMQRFLNLSGMDVAQLRDNAGTAAVSLAVIDFLMSDEPLLIAFCEDSQRDPRKMQSARFALGAGA